MAADTIELKLPVSGKTVVIRNYTTNRDDEIAETLMYMGVNTETKITGDKKASEEMLVKLPMGNIMASKRAYVPELVQSIDGSSENITEQLGNLRSEDFKAIADKVEEIVDEHSPKATAVSVNKNAA